MCSHVTCNYTNQSNNSTTPKEEEPFNSPTNFNFENMHTGWQALLAIYVSWLVITRFHRSALLSLSPHETHIMPELPTRMRTTY